MNGDGKAAYTYPEGSGSKSGYKPKSLFFHHRVTEINKDKYKLDSVKFVLILGKYNVKENALPTVKVFTGDDNSPYRTNPLCTVKTAKHLPNKADFDSYTLEYTLSNVTIAQLKDLIVEVDFTKTKTTKASTISINRARFEVSYSDKSPKISIWDWISTISPEVGEKVTWKIAAKNTGGSTGKGKVKVTLPKGATLLSSTGDGTLSGLEWSFTVKPGNSNSIHRYFYLQFDNVGNKELIADNQMNATNARLTQYIAVAPSYIGSVTPINPGADKRDDLINYIFYDTNSKAEDQYFDVEIHGFANNTMGFDHACYQIESNDLGILTPLRENAFLLQGNTNIKKLETVTSFINHNESLDIDVEVTPNDNTLCFELDNPLEDWIINIRVPFDCNSTGVKTVTINDTNNTNHTGTVEILEPPKNVFSFVPAISRDKQFVQNSVNIGVRDDIWTIQAKASRRNFFQEKQSDLVVSIEELIAYIGCVPLSRAHKADEKANTTNTLIKTSYLNRKYLGKQGDTDEEIPMTLRMPWPDVATLQGLVAMDKPIPIDTCPEILDGDPVNHRGWAEIYGVKNIHKVNDLLYECEPEVDYITHDILTKFNVQMKDKITNTTLDYYLGETHKYGDDLLERFRLNYYQFYANEENTNGDLVGSYDIPSEANLTMNSIDGLSKYSNYNIVYSNTLPALMSEDYDGNWEMSLRILDKDSRNVLFEHLYDNFKHYDFNDSKVINQCDVTTKLWTGSKYEVLNQDTVNLLYDEVKEAEDNNRIMTYFNRVEDVEFSSLDSKLEIFLLDKNNNPLGDKKVVITIQSLDNAYSEVFYSLTDLFGRATFPVLLDNGDYTARFYFAGDEEYYKCEYIVNMSIRYNEREYHFNYPDSFTALTNGALYEVQLLNSNDDPVSGYSIQYSFRDYGSEEYSHEETLMTDSEGKAYVPVNFTNGSKWLKVIFKGFEENGTVHQPVFFEDLITIDVPGKGVVIEADDVTLMQGDNKIYHVTLKDKDGNRLHNQEVTIGFSNANQNYTTTVTTTRGVATTPIICGTGVWNVSVLFKGDSFYAPAYVSKHLTVLNFQRLNTILTNVAGNSFTEEDTGINYTVKLQSYVNALYKNTYVPLEDQPIKFKVYDTNDNLLAEMTRKTDENGEAKIDYLNHGVTVRIDSEFAGNVKYAEASLSEEVYYAVSVTDALTPTMDLVEENGTYSIVVEYEGDVDGVHHHELLGPNSTIIHNVNKFYSVMEGADINQLGIGTYKITATFNPQYIQGRQITYGLTKTFTLTKNTDGRTAYPEQNLIIGSLYRMDTGRRYINGSSTRNNLCVGQRIQIGFYLSRVSVSLRKDVTFTLYGGYENGDYTWKVTRGYHENTTYDQWFDLIDGIVSPNDRYKIVVNINDDLKLPFEKEFTLDSEWNIETITCSSLKPSQITESGFGLENKTYNMLQINASSTDYYNSFADKIFDYYKVRVINPKTREIIKFDNITQDSTAPALLNMMLVKGDYELEILGEPTEHYSGAIINKEASITTDSEIEPDESTSGIVDYSEIIVMPSIDIYDGSVYGSNIYFELRNNILQFIDYGMVRDNTNGSGDIILNDITLPVADYELEIDINYKNHLYNRLNNLTGRIQMNIWEDVSTSEGATQYNNLICSPMPVNKGITKFTRYTDEGTMYFVQVKNEDNPNYICNPYIQYKGGTELTSINNISLFNLDNGYSPVAMNNGLVKAQFHRRTGYVELFRYDETTKDWYECNILKLPDNPQLRLESYTDDSIELTFGETTWKMWRGRPFIQLKHADTDIRILNLVNRVYAETVMNEFTMGTVEEQDSLYSIFNPRTSIQRFPSEIHVGQSIREDNFRLYNASVTNRLYALTYDVDLDTVYMGKDKAIHIIKNEPCRVGLNFPATPVYVEKPGADFSLLISNITYTGTSSNCVLKVRGFDERGAVPIKETVQLGLYESNHNVTLESPIRVNFSNVPDEVKYVDFTLITPDTISEITMKNIMLYEGDADIEYQRDTSKHNASTAEIHFTESYYCCLYDEKDPSGLGIFRLGKEPFTLRSLASAEETVLVPYMKNAAEWDRVENIFMEYLNSREQIVNIDWEK